MKMSVILLLFLSTFSVCDSSKILALMPTPCRSHATLLERLVLELGARGHEVTYASAFPFPKPVKNVKEVIIPNVHSILFGNMFELRHKPTFGYLMFFPVMGQMMVRELYNSPQIKQLINSKERFDLVIGEAFMSEGLLVGFAHKFNAPVVCLGIIAANQWINYMVGNPSPMSYIPNQLLKIDQDMGLLDRTINSVFGVLEAINHEYRHLPMQDALMRENFGAHLPPIHDLVKNVSLALVNHHYSLAFPRPYLPNIVEIGGYHVAPLQELPKDLKKYLDDSKNGAVLFSMGSNLKSSLMTPEKKQMFLNVFSKLKQNVLWKFEDESLTNLTSNVKVSKWLLQSDILAHPNLKLFITHGGLLSTTEAVLWGVPVIGIPIFGDQPLNMRVVHNQGLGIKLDYDELSEDMLFDAINQILTNPKYKETVQQRSALLRDKPMPAIDTAMYWIEYVIRHKGAPHMRSAAQDLAWYQLYLLDVMAVLAAGVAVVLTIGFCIARWIFRKFFGKRTNKTETKKQKKTN